MALKYYVVDTETTGLNSAYHEMTEISIIRADDKVQLTEMIKCEYPDRASLDALRITNKTKADLSLGRKTEDVIEKINSFLNEDGLTPAHRCFIGHNVISFDKKFIFALFEKANLECPVHLWLDTLAMTKQFLKQSDETQLNISRTPTGKVSFKLQACCDLVGGFKKYAAAHASNVDARNTFLLWKRLTEEKNIDHLPFHKTFIHKLKKDEDLERLDIDDFENPGEIY